MCRILSVLPMLATLSLALGLAACGRQDAAASSPSAAAALPAPWQLPVLAVAAASAPEPPVVGAVVPSARIDIASRLGGRIAEMRVQEGDAVRRGQLLVRLEAAEVDGAIRQSDAGVESASAAWRDAVADLERFKALASRGSVSHQELGKVQLRKDTAEQALQQARAARDTAAAQRGQALLQSPIDGTVVARSKRAGDLALPGQPLLTLDASDGLLFEAQVPESRSAGLRPGQPAEVVIDGQPRPLQGTVVRVLPSSDAVARRQLVKISLPAASGLAAGQFGRASLSTDDAAALALPRTALVERGGLRGAFVVDADERAAFRWLRTGREWADAQRGPMVEITAGLQPRERVLAQVPAALREGDRIATGAVVAR